MTYETASSAPSEVLSGHIVARFVYASRGTQGWGVSGEVGSVPVQVMEEAVGYLERLKSPAGYQMAPEDLRERRFLFAGSPGSVWRFLLNSVAAGADASGRSDNCFSDCMVVQSDPMADGSDPAMAYYSPGWLMPYGAEQVAAADPRARGDAALHLDGSHSTTLRQLVQHDVQTLEGAGYLRGVARLVECLRSPETRSTSTWVGVPQLPWAPILLSVLYGLLPYDIAWDTTFEIRKAPLDPADRSQVVLRFVDENLMPSGAQRLSISTETVVVEPQRSACQTCGRPVTTWSDLLISCLSGLATMLHEGETRDEAGKMADLLWRFCATLRRDRVPASEYPRMFADDRLPSEYARLTDLFGVVHAHDHVEPRSYLPDPAGIVSFLQQQTPTDLTAAVALRQFERFGPRMTAEMRTVLEIHIDAGDPPEAQQAWLERVAAMPTDSWHLLSSSPAPLGGVVAGRLLRAVAILGCTHYASSAFPRAITPNHITWALSAASNREWAEPILHLELFDKFLQSWVAPQPGLGDVTALLSQPKPGGASSPVGYLMMRDALDHAEMANGSYYLRFLDRSLRIPGQLSQATDGALRDLQRVIRQALGDERAAAPGGWHG